MKGFCWDTIIYASPILVVEYFRVKNIIIYLVLGLLTASSVEND